MSRPRLQLGSLLLLVAPLALLDCGGQSGGDERSISERSDAGRNPSRVETDGGADGPTDSDPPPIPGSSGPTRIPSQGAGGADAGVEPGPVGGGAGNPALPVAGAAGSAGGGAGPGGTGPAGGFGPGGTGPAGGFGPGGAGPAGGFGPGGAGPQGGFGPTGGYFAGGSSGYGGQSQVPDPEVPLADGCSAPTRPGSVDWCNLDAECAEGFRSAYCDDWNGQWQCLCDANGDGHRFELEGGESSTACVKAIEVCPTIADLPLVEEECTLDTASATATSCRVQHACPHSADVGDGFTLSQVDNPSASCESGDPDWTCSCNANGSLVRHDVAAGDPLTVCSSALSTCIANELELTAPMECTPRNQDATLESCNSYSGCTQDAMLGTTIAEARGNLATRCSRVEPGNWSCECSVSSTPLTFDIAGDLGWDVCTEANEVCKNELDLVGTADGPYSGAGGSGGY